MRLAPLFAAPFAALCGLLLTGSAPSAEPRPEFSIGAIADCQFADAPDNGQRLYHTAPAKLTAAIADFNRQHLAFVVHLGDFIDRDWKSFDTLLPIARQSHAPLFFALGNHEFEVADARKREVPARLGLKTRYYSFEQHGWMFIATDGNDLSSYAWPKDSPELARSMAVHAALYPDKPLWDGGIGEAQMRWIDAQLATADRRGLKVMLFSHFPLFPENPHNLWNAPDVIAMLERHASAKIWLDGHNHDGNYGVRAGIHYVNLKAMLDTPDTAYARLDFFPDRVIVHGTGRQRDLVLPLR